MKNFKVSLTIRMGFQGAGGFPIIRDYSTEKKNLMNFRINNQNKKSREEIEQQSE